MPNSGKFIAPEEFPIIGLLREAPQTGYISSDRAYTPPKLETIYKDNSIAGVSLLPDNGLYNRADNPFRQTEVSILTRFTTAQSGAIRNLTTVPPLEDIVAFDNMWIGELSYYDLLLKSVDTGSLTDSTGYAGALGGAFSNRPLVEDFILETDVNESGTFINTGEANVSSHAKLGSLIPKAEENIVVSLTDMVNIDLVSVGNVATINNEILRVVSIDEDECTLARGCVDTLPATHSIGDDIFFYSSSTLGLSTAETIINDSVEIRLLPRINDNTLPPEDAPIEVITINARQARPYPPAQVRINDEYDADRISGQMEITWANRNRLTQGLTLLDQTAASVGLEADSGIRVRIYDLDDNLVRTYNDLQTTELEYPVEDVIADGILQDIKVVVDSHREAIDSTQQHEFTIARYGLGLRLGESLGGL